MRGGPFVVGGLTACATRWSVSLEMSNIAQGAGVIGPDGSGYGKPAPLPDQSPRPEAYGL